MNSLQYQILKRHALHGVDGWPVVIDSLKRMSDGEVFSIGMAVLTNSGRGEHKITSFEIIDGQMCVRLDGFKTEYEFLSKINPMRPNIHQQKPQTP